MNSTVAELVRAGGSGNPSKHLMLEKVRRNDGMEESQPGGEMWGNVA